MINENLIAGILLLVSLLLGYGGAWLTYHRSRISLALLLIILTGFGLRIFCALDPMLHPWDERYHALVAKNMMTDPFTPKLYPEQVLDYDYKNWAANKIWLHKQPLPLWTMAASMKIFGVSEFTVRLPSVVLSTLCIFLTFWIGRFLSSSDRVGLIAAFLLSINGLVIELASGRVATDHVDTFFMFFVTLSVYFILINLKKDKKIFLVLTGVTCGAAIMTKWLPALVVFPVYLALNFKTKRISKLFVEMLLMGVVTLIIMLPWQLYVGLTFPLEYQWEQHHNVLHFTEGLDGRGKPWWYFIDRIRITINDLVYLVFVWFIFRMIKGKELNRAYLSLLIWMLIPFLVFSIAATKMQGYLLFTFPAWFIVTGMFVENLLVVKPTSSMAKKGYWLIIGAIFILAFRYGLERVKPFEDHQAEALLKKELTDTTHPSKTVIFNEAHPIEWMFYNEGLAYPGRPENGLVDSLQSAGWLVF